MSAFSALSKSSASDLLSPAGHLSHRVSGSNVAPPKAANPGLNADVIAQAKQLATARLARIEELKLAASSGTLPSGRLSPGDLRTPTPEAFAQVRAELGRKVSEQVQQSMQERMLAVASPHQSGGGTLSPRGTGPVLSGPAIPVTAAMLDSLPSPHSIATELDLHLQDLQQRLQASAQKIPSSTALLQAWNSPIPSPPSPPATTASEQFTARAAHPLPPVNIHPSLLAAAARAPQASLVPSPTAGRPLPHMPAVQSPEPSVPEPPGQSPAGRARTASPAKERGSGWRSKMSSACRESEQSPGRRDGWKQAVLADATPLPTGAAAASSTPVQAGRDTSPGLVQKEWSQFTSARTASPAKERGEGWRNRLTTATNHRAVSPNKAFQLAPKEANETAGEGLALSATEQARGVALFESMDADGSGTVEVREIGLVEGLDAKTAMVKVLDKDQNQKVDLGEWKAYLAQKKQEKGADKFAHFLGFLEDRLKEQSEVVTPAPTDAHLSGVVKELQRALAEAQSEIRVLRSKDEHREIEVQSLRSTIAQLEGDACVRVPNGLLERVGELTHELSQVVESTRNPP